MLVNVAGPLLPNQFIFHQNQMEFVILRVVVHKVIKSKIFQFNEILLIFQVFLHDGSGW